MEYILSLLDQLTYPVIWFLMTLESTVIPVPSELVVAPAAYNAADGQMNVLLVIAMATLGADCGATINYLAGYYLGRPIIYKFANSRWGKLCLLNEDKVRQSEQYFDRHGVAATITGRLIPGIRHLISIPAGLAKMNFWKFIVYTTLGAGVWNCILAALGWWLYSFVPRAELNDKVEQYSHYIVGAIVAVVAIAIVWLVAKNRHKKNPPQQTKDNGTNP